jgi:type IV secretion system protein VirB10
LAIDLITNNKNINLRGINMSIPESKSEQNVNDSTTNNYSNNYKNNNEGLPDIADTKHNNFILIVIIGISILALILVWWFHRIPSVTKQTAADETFSYDNQVPTLTLPRLTPEQKQRVQQAVANVNNLPSPSQDNEDAQKAILMRLQAPMMVVGQNNQKTNNILNTTDNTNSQANNNALSTNDTNTNYLNQVSNEGVETVNANVLQNRSTLIAQGNLIHAILETAVDSDLPGFLRAIVSEPVYSEDGSQVLIEPGSRLIGQYKSGMLAGQNRIFTVWTRVIEPNGISVQIGSPGIDNLGVSGQGADNIDYHFWQMFGTASLLSILSAGASNVDVNSSDEDNASQEYRQAISQSLAQSSSNSLQQYANLAPTLHINQGTPIMVFVAKDLRFDTAIKQTKFGINIF